VVDADHESGYAGRCSILKGAGAGAARCSQGTSILTPDYGTSMHPIDEGGAFAASIAYAQIRWGPEPMGSTAENP
jgi:hypothetical protein